ncbi:glycoside hydrolase family 61 protein [Moniliophthora roreri MCA 2997]|uniref:Glycoside hydrolase family 61 protein n=1 Tax=Moniliophthora roreri (strain MCA 2997) TaxID=1381753 RepID=V2XT58_MONRO|nr:glycoside hydrolase family 61 protein [Moniliophthora roreri MCA 2997]
MFIPTQSQSTTDASSTLSLNTDCQYGARSRSMAILLAFMLTFYALALWDRYLVLKLRESEKLDLRMRYTRLASLPSPPNYGSMDTYKRTSSYLKVPPNDRAFFGERPPTAQPNQHAPCLVIPVPPIKIPST